MDYKAVVEKYREIYKGLSGPERAWTITNAVALEIKTGWGLIFKPSGMNWNSYSIDCLINLYSREFVDCLGNSDLEASPQWGAREASPEELTRWRPPVEGNTPPVIPPVTPPIVPPVTPPVIILPRDSIQSVNKIFTLAMQDDGNLVLYKSGVPIWASGTNGK